MIAYLINLEKAKERLAHSIEILTNEGFVIQRIDAVNGRELELNKTIFNKLLYGVKHGKRINQSEVGCYLSHIKAMQEFLFTKDSHALIVEDDIDILENTKEVIEKALKYEKRWDILRLSGLHRGMPVHCVPVSDDKFLSINLARLMGSGAYVVNRNAAEVLVKRLLPMTLPYDHAYDREWFYGLKAMSINPPTVLQDNLPFVSQIKEVKNSKYPTYIRYWTVFPFRFFSEFSRLIFRVAQLIRFKLSSYYQE